MLQSFYNSITGVKSQQFGMDLTANNVANVNTAGYKASYAEFKTLYEKSVADSFMGPTRDQIGLGSTPKASALDMSQGSLENTDREFDLAIGGDGWFNVASAANEEQFYTRDGNFHVNSDGFLVNSSGHYLMGIGANNIDGDTLNPNQTLDPLSNQMGPIEIPTHLIFPPTPTSQVSLQKNLVFGTEYQKQSIGIVDPQGERTNLVLEFEPSAVQPGVGSRWDYVAHIENSDDDPLTGSLDFDALGGLLSDPIISMDNGGTNLNLNLGGGFDGVVSTTGEVNTGVVANGKPRGDLTNYRVDNNGNIVASFDNSESATIGKIPLYHFINDQGLTKDGTNLFKQSSNSGDPQRFIDENGDFTMGTRIMSHMLEYSNAELSQSLTNLIVYQKAFDANSRGITTSDQMIQTAINMKR